jgi:hypothetical protein
MKYYAIKNTEGDYWSGVVKLCYPPILVCDSDQSKAMVSRVKSEMDNRVKESQQPEKYQVCEIDSVDHKHLAD